VEYVSAFCDLDNENVLVQNVEKEESKERAMKNMEQRQASNPKKPRQPVNINYLLIDSLSRPHFLRALPRTVAMVEELHTGIRSKLHDFDDDEDDDDGDDGWHTDKRFKSSSPSPSPTTHESTENEKNKKEKVETPKPSGKVFQFFRFNILGENSAPNLTPLASGMSQRQIGSLYNSEMNSKSPNPAWIWEFAHKYDLS